MTAEQYYRNKRHRQHLIDNESIKKKTRVKITFVDIPNRLARVVLRETFLKRNEKHVHIDHLGKLIPILDIDLEVKKRLLFSGGMEKTLWISDAGEKRIIAEYNATINGESYYPVDPYQPEPLNPFAL